MENKNKTFVVGTFKDLEVRQGEANGKEYVAGKFKVEVSKENIVSHTFFSYKTNKDGSASARYKNYSDLQRFKGVRVKVTGNLSSRAFYSTREGQVIHFNEISANFVNIAKDTEKNTATFDYSGYVIKPLHERENKEGELVAYEIEIGQADYSGDNLIIVRFTVSPDDNEKMIGAIHEQYTKNTTVSIMGKIKHKVEVITQTEEVAFGEPITKTFENVLKTYEITGGKEPIVSDEAYTEEQIKKLEDNYQNYLTKTEKEAKEKAKSGQTTVKDDTPAKSEKSRLI